MPILSPKLETYLLLFVEGAQQARETADGRRGGEDLVMCSESYHRIGKEQIRKVRCSCNLFRPRNTVEVDSLQKR